MANNSIDEALKQASGANKSQPNSNYKTQEIGAINDNRKNITSEAYLDGLWASNDYLEGFTQGFTDGVIQGREQVLHQISANFRASRNVPLTIDLTTICDNFPQMESQIIFQLPEAS